MLLEATNTGELINHQACSPNQNPVNLWGCKESCDISALHRSAIQDPGLLRGLGRYQLTDGLAQFLCDLCGLLARGNFSCADSPNRFICDYEITNVLVTFEGLG